MRLAAASEVERMTGIEPALSAWEAEVLPLNYIRVACDPRVSADLVSKLFNVTGQIYCLFMVFGGSIEQLKGISDVRALMRGLDVVLVSNGLRPMAELLLRHVCSRFD